VEGRTFTSLELIEHCEIASDAELEAAILAAVGSLSPRKLGRLLAEVEGEVLDGLRVRRCGDGRQGLRWQITCVKVARAAQGFA
jgi:hypothetical protein